MKKPALPGLMLEVDRQTLSHRVYDRIKDAILDRTLSPGDRLNECEIARDMSVSNTPVREALRRLAAEGLVRIVPWKGAIVEDFADKQFLEIYQCREVLEGLACRLAALSIDKAGLDALRKLLVSAEKARSPSRLAGINSDIHNVIIRYSGNSRVDTLLRIFNDVILRHRGVTAYSQERRASIQREHEAVVRALEDKDPQRAEEAMRFHVRQGWEFIQVVGLNPDPNVDYVEPKE